MTFQQFSDFFNNFSYIFSFIVELFKKDTYTALSYLLYHTDTLVIQNWSGAFLTLNAPLYYFEQLFTVIIDYVSSLNYIGGVAGFIVSVPLALVQFLSSSIFWILTGILPEFILNMPFACGLPFIIVFIALFVRIFKFVLNLVKVE